MSGPNPPGPESEELEPGPAPSQADGEFEGGGNEFGEGPVEEADADGQTGQTDVYSRAYSAPESEHFSSAPYVAADRDLYDYDSYGEVAQDEEAATPRWPWIVGVAAIVAAIALVVSVSLLFARTDTTKVATPSTAPTSTPPMQDEIIVTTTPSSSSEAPPPPPPPAAAHRAAATAPAAGPRAACTCPSAGSGPRARAARTGAPARTRRAQAIHVFGDRHQGAVRPDHHHLHRCLGDAADAVQRLHPVDDHADTELSV